VQTVLKVDQKYLEMSEMCWRRIEEISWTDHVGKDGVLQKIREQRSILHTIKRRKANCTGHILRRNCLIKRIIVENV
jgi:hypothetical protein